MYLPILILKLVSSGIYAGSSHSPLGWAMTGGNRRYAAGWSGYFPKVQHVIQVVGEVVPELAESDAAAAKHHDQLWRVGDCFGGGI